MKIELRVLVTAFFFLSIQILTAQNVPTDTSYWTSGSQSSLTFSQVSLKNWAAGGENSSSINSFLSIFVDYQKSRHKWQNSMDLGYGILKQGDQKPQKSDDKINLVTNYGYQVTAENDKWFFTILLDFKSQFTEGISPDDPDSVISRFMAPGYLTIGSGLEYAPNEFVSFSYQPVTGKITFVTDEKIVGVTGAYGVESGKSSRAELGSYFRFLYQQEAFKNVNVDLRLELFTGYESESFGNIDVNWQNTVIMKINKYLSTNLFTQLLYDDDVKIGIDSNNDGVVDKSKQKIQFKSVFGIGLTFQLGANRAE
ncbi:MAG: DUF3078 domain-containing protein [Cytophagales bacterium]|nr:DUF3078 domain-containing protein [Cytophagales bacterium]